MQQAYRDMGIGCAKSVALHLSQENAHENNLLSDIAAVD